MTAPPVCVEADFDLHALDVDDVPYRVPRHVPAVLRWLADDPWAVQLDFARGPVWTIGWDLLVQAARCGGRRVVGDGDVRIRRASVHHFEVVLANRQYASTFRAHAWDLVVFVKAVAPRQPPAAARAAAVGHALLRVLLDGAR